MYKKDGKTERSDWEVEAGACKAAEGRIKKKNIVFKKKIDHSKKNRIYVVSDECV